MRLETFTSPPCIYNESPWNHFQKIMHTLSISMLNSKPDKFCIQIAKSRFLFLFDCRFSQLYHPDVQWPLRKSMVSSNFKKRHCKARKKWQINIRAVRYGFQGYVWHCTLLTTLEIKIELLLPIWKIYHHQQLGTAFSKLGTMKYYFKSR